MDKKYSSLPLRSGVGIVVLNKENKVFVAKRIDNPKDFWQMPQGGVDSGEDFLKAAYRELEEETSIKSVKLIKELDGMITYELPERLLGIIWKGKYRGQKQKWFLMRFTGTIEKFNIQTHHFKGNYPASFTIQGSLIKLNKNTNNIVNISKKWSTIINQTNLKPHDQLVVKNKIKKQKFC